MQKRNYIADSSYFKSRLKSKFDIINMKKVELRKAYRNLRNELCSDEIGGVSEEVLLNLKKLNIWDGKHNFHVFLSIKGKKEIDTSLLITHLWGRGKTVIVSRSNFENNTLTNFIYHINSKIEENSYGIPEPVDAENFDDKEIDIVFVPLMAFDKRGYRVGYGGGFYDNFLANCKKDVIKVGLSFFEPQEDDISDIHENDIKMDYCVTPTNIYEF